MGEDVVEGFCGSVLGEFGGVGAVAGEAGVGFGADPVEEGDAGEGKGDGGGGDFGDLFVGGGVGREVWLLR